MQREIKAAPPKVYVHAANAAEPLFFLLIGAGCGAFLAVLFQVTSLSGDMANLLGGLVGPGLGAGLAVVATLYINKRQERAELQSEALARLELLAMIDFSLTRMIACLQVSPIPFLQLRQNNEALGQFLKSYGELGPPPRGFGPRVMREHFHVVNIVYRLTASIEDSSRSSFAQANALEGAKLAAGYRTDLENLLRAFTR